MVRATIPTVVALSFLLTGCGESKTEEPKSSTANPPAGVTDAMAAAAKALAASPDSRKAAIEGVRTAASRPLTAADVEAVLEFMPKMRDAEGDRAKMAEILRADAPRLAEWGLLSARIVSAAQMAKSGRINEKYAADVEVVRPYLDRLEAAMKAR